MFLYLKNISWIYPCQRFLVPITKISWKTCFSFYTVPKQIGFLTLLFFVYFSSSWRRTFCTNVGYKHYFGKEPLLALTIGQLFEKSVDKFYNKEAIISCHENSRMTFSELKQKVSIYVFKYLKTLKNVFHTLYSSFVLSLILVFPETK